jgi:hypothetical protein
MRFKWIGNFKLRLQRGDLTSLRKHSAAMRAQNWRQRFEEAGAFREFDTPKSEETILARV